jgi:hypothetical protein
MSHIDNRFGNSTQVPPMSQCVIIFEVLLSQKSN